MTILNDRIDGLSSSTAIKGPCRVATTANITLSGLQTIDGVSLAAGDRVLVRAQTSAVNNGIYVADSGPWRRAKDFAQNRDVRKGTRVLVTDGAVYANSEWWVSSLNPQVIGTSSINFSQNLLSAANLAAIETEAEAHRDAAESARDAGQQYRDEAETARDEAEAFAGAAAAAGTQIPVAATRAALKVINSATTPVAFLKERLREGQWVWNANILIATHQADPLEQTYIAPNPAANGAWVRVRPQDKAPILLSDLSDRHVAKERQLKTPALLLLPDPTAMDEREVRLLSTATPKVSPEPLMAFDGKWWDLSSKTERSPWWLPPGASLVIDRKRGHYYWGGAVKSAGDLTAESVGYYMSDVSWMDPAVGFTLMVEWDCPDSGSFAATEQVFSMSNTAAGNRRLFVDLRAETTAKGQPQVQYQDATQYLSAIVPNYRLPHISDTAKMLGRRRAVWSLNPGSFPLSATDGMPVATGGTAVVAQPVFNRVHVGYGKLAGTVQQSFTGDVDSITVVGWPYAMTSAQIERLMADSMEARPPLHILADSYGNGQFYSLGGSLQDRIRKRVKDAGRYLMFSDDALGNTTLVDQATRFDVYPRYWDSTLLILEGGHDPMYEDMLPAIRQMVSRLSHNRWAIIEPGYSYNWHTPGLTARDTLDTHVQLLKAFAGDDHFIPTKAGMMAANDGSANDLLDVANGTWPRSLMGDNIHPNALGSDTLGGIIFDWLAAKGWA